MSIDWPPVGLSDKRKKKTKRLVEELPKWGSISEWAFAIHLPAKPGKNARALSKALCNIHQRYGDFTYIPLAYHKNGQLKTLYVFTKEMMG